jgi:predicted hotdog family 3-hydroxylacyl-ACP dehydratase
MTDCLWPMAELVPHATPTILLDKVTAWSTTGLTASLTIRPETRFMRLGRRAGTYWPGMDDAGMRRVCRTAG